MDLHQRMTVAQSAMRTVGEMLRARGDIAVYQKAENDYVTEMDFKSESMLRKALLEAFPEDVFYGEEGGQSGAADGRWIVDPIDGTLSFMHHQRSYTISVAYEYKGELMLGCVYSPENDEMFSAIKGEGAFLNGKPIHVTDEARLDHSVVCFSYGQRVPAIREEVLPKLPNVCRSVSDLRRSGSAAQDICSVACGRNEAFFEMGLSLYDFAAGEVILLEAGGKFSGWSDGEDYHKTGNVFGSNGAVHEALFALIRRDA